MNRTLTKALLLCRASSSRQPSGLFGQFKQLQPILASTASRQLWLTLAAEMLSWREWRLRRPCTAWTLSAARRASLLAIWLIPPWVSVSYSQILGHVLYSDKLQVL
jgi:hypothetical protein